MPRTPRTRSSMARNWCFTLNNPTVVDIARCKALVEDGVATYAVFQLEEGEQGTPHLQGYVTLVKKVRMTTLKTKLAPMQPHLEVASGNAAQNRKYCTKAEGRLDGPWEYGEMTLVGKQALMKILFDCVEAGWTQRQMTQAYPALLGHSKAIAYAVRLRSEASAKRWREVMVTVRIGGTGLGKTREAIGGDYEGCYVWSKTNAKGSTNWFDGYEHQDHLILDEIQPGDFTIAHMLRLLDGNPLTMQVKGASVSANFTRVTLTSNFPVAAWFPKAGEHSMAALRRRISETWMYSIGPSGEATRTNQDGVQRMVVFEDPESGGSGSRSGGNTGRSSTSDPSPTAAAAAATLATLVSPPPLVRSHASIWTHPLAGRSGVGRDRPSTPDWTEGLPLSQGSGGGGASSLPPGQGPVEIDLTLLDEYDSYNIDYSVPLLSDSEIASAHTSEETVGYMSPFAGLSISDSD